jgi:CheY-like chemotaxis protein
LGADVETVFHPEGLMWSMSGEANRIVAPGAPVRTQPEQLAVRAQGGGAPVGSQGRILIVEDEPLVGMEIAEALQEAGFAVLGPVSSNADALALLMEQGCDAAVLDVNLGRETSEPLALKFKAEGVPFVTLTGYAPDQTPAAFREAPLLTKPILTEVLIAELASIARARSS